MSVVLWVVLGFVGLVWVMACVLWVMAGMGVIDPVRQREREAIEREMDQCPDVPFPEEAIGHQPLAIREEFPSGARLLMADP